jgi:hypothetical protein
MHILATYVSCAAAVLLMVEASSFKFNRRRCQLCHQRGEHLAGCPGRDR